MFQLSILLLWLCLLTTFILMESKYKLMSPEFGFVVCFIPGILYAFAYIDKWELRFDSITIITMIVGTLTFVLASFLSRPFCKIHFKVMLRHKHNNRSEDINEYISAWKILVIIILQLIALVGTIAFLVSRFGTNLSHAIYAFRIANMSVGTDSYVTLPSVVRALRRVCLASGYVVMFLFLHGLLYKNKKNRHLELICIILTLINGSTLGGRGDALQLLAAGVIQFFIISRYKNGRKFIEAKSILKIFLLVGIVILTFAHIGELMGRNMSFLKFSDYIAIYLSAELKNLDIFVRKRHFGADVSSVQTLTNVVNVMSLVLGKPEWYHSLDLAFNYINGYALGNVCTIFYAFLYDGGIGGVILYTSLMAIFCQKLYQSTFRVEMKSNISISTIVYSFVWFTIIFSFFSNKFYEIVISTSFLWCLGAWIALKWFFEKK